MKKSYFINFKTKSNLLIAIVMFFSMVLVLLTSGLASSFVVSVDGKYQFLKDDFVYTTLSAGTIDASKLQFDNTNHNFCYGKLVSINDKNEIVAVTSNSFQSLGLPYFAENDPIYYKTKLSGVINSNSDKVFYLHKSLKNSGLEDGYTFNEVSYTFNGYFDIRTPKYNKLIQSKPLGSATIIIVDKDFVKQNTDFDYYISLDINNNYVSESLKKNFSGKNIIKNAVEDQKNAIEYVQGIMTISIIVLFISCGSLNYYILGDLKKDLMKRKLLGMNKIQCFNNLFSLSFVITLISSIASYFISFLIVYLITGIGFLKLMTSIFFIVSFLFTIIESLIFTKIIYRHSILSLFEKELEEVC